MANETAYFVAEYHNRMRLRKLGFVDDLENLDAVTAEFFIEISQQLNRLESEEMKSKSSKAGF
jgi:hypothetical protein